MSDVATSPRETKPGGGTGCQSASPSATPFAIAASGTATRSNRTGAAVNAGESRITSTGSVGGAFPYETQSPRDAYPAGGVGRHTAHDAAPDAAPETPSRKTPCAEEEEEEEEEDQTGAKTPHGRAGEEATAAASLCDTRVSVAIFEGDSARRNGPLTTVTRASTPSLRAPVAASVCEIIRNVRSTGNSTSSPAARSIQRRAPASHSGRLTPTRSSCTCTSVSTTPSSSSSSSLKRPASSSFPPRLTTTPDASS